MWREKNYCNLDEKRKANWERMEKIKQIWELELREYSVNPNKK